MKAEILNDGWHKIEIPHLDDEVRMVKDGRVIIEKRHSIPVDICIKWGWKFTPVHVLTQAEYADLEQAAPSVPNEWQKTMLDALDIYEEDVNTYVPQWDNIKKDWAKNEDALAKLAKIEALRAWLQQRPRVGE